MALKLCSVTTWSRIQPVVTVCKHFASFPPKSEPQIPEWKKPENEDEKLTRARLLYQSRKRGMLENGLLLSSFADKYLSSMTSKQLHQYDTLINKPSNDWDIYYWVTGNLETPADFECEVMDLLKEHAKNTNKESRITQPKLKPS